MHFAYDLAGASAIVKTYQVDQTFGTAGVHALISASGESGVDLGTTTGMVDALGVTLDTATKQTAQQTAPATAAELLSIVINPLGVVKARLAGGAAGAVGTALTQATITTASTDGLSVVSSGFDPNSPDLADGVVWGYSGSNPSAYRKVTATASNDATVEIPFDTDIAVGDVFLYANRYEGDVSGITLTSDLTEVDAEAAEATTGAMRVVNMELRDISGEGTLKSYFYLIFADHAYRGTT